MRLRSRARVAGALGCVVALATPAAADAARWQPRPGTTWQWQLSGRVDLGVRVATYDVDLFEAGAAVVADLHRLGRRAVCYFSAGTYEEFRADAEGFPAQTRGRPLEDFPDERWLDIRRIDLLRPVIEARLDLCRRQGYDGVEPDNVDGYANDSGFPLKASHQLAFNRYLARAAHARGLAVGLKNDLGQVRELEPSFDFAVNEQCFEFRECDGLRRFVRRGKAVFHVEYALPRSRFCARARKLRFSSMVKRVELDAYRLPC